MYTLTQKKIQCNRPRGKTIYNDKLPYAINRSLYIFYPNFEKRFLFEKPLTTSFFGTGTMATSTK